MAVIQRLAEDLNRRLSVRDPLSERVRHSKAEAAALALSAALALPFRRRSVAPRESRRRPKGSTSAAHASTPPDASASGASGSSFYAGMRVLPKAGAGGHVRRLWLLPDRGRHRRRPGRRPHLPAGRTSTPGAPTWRASTPTVRPVGPRFLAEPVRRFGLAKSDFLAVDRRDADGRGRRRPGAKRRGARPLHRPCGERRRPAIGARVRHGRGRRAWSWPTISAARCSSPTFCGTSTRMPRSAAYMCPARRWTVPGSCERGSGDGGERRQDRRGRPRTARPGPRALRGSADRVLSALVRAAACWRRASCRPSMPAPSTAPPPPAGRRLDALA